jgi:hypothetical protein
MSRIIFMADTPDASTPTTIYGKDHQMDLADEVQVQTLLARGKAALMGAAVRGVFVSGITATGATINWIVDQPCTGMLVNYGTTTAYGLTQNATPAAGVGAITAAITGLTTATTYHYRISVTVGTAITLTADATFRTN